MTEVMIVMTILGVIATIMITTIKPAEYKEKALDFALFLTNKENQLEFSKLTSVLPANKNALNDEFFIKDDKTDLISRAKIISAKQTSNMQPPLKNFRNKKNLNILSSQAVQRILINNEDIEKTLNEFRKDWENL